MPECHAPPPVALHLPGCAVDSPLATGRPNEARHPRNAAASALPAFGHAPRLTPHIRLSPGAGRRSRGRVRGEGWRLASDICCAPGSRNGRLEPVATSALGGRQTGTIQTHEQSRGGLQTKQPASSDCQGRKSRTAHVEQHAGGAPSSCLSVAHSFSSSLSSLSLSFFLSRCRFAVCLLFASFSQFTRKRERERQRELCPISLAYRFASSVGQTIVEDSWSLPVFCRQSRGGQGEGESSTCITSVGYSTRAYWARGRAANGAAVGTKGMANGARAGGWAWIARGNGGVCKRRWGVD